MNASPTPQTPPLGALQRLESTRLSPQRLLLAFLGLLALSIAFYYPVLDNDFWHDEDFEVIQRVQQISHDPARLLNPDITGRHHPVPLALFYWEYSQFGLNARGWYFTNLVLHAFNAWLVFWLVIALLPDRRIALLSGVLFALGVGSYGKAILFAAGSENLLIASLYLLVLNLYIRNDLYGEGKLLSFRYLSVLLLFVLVSLAKPTTFSLLGGIMAYKVFYRGERGKGRTLFEPHLTILLLTALAFYITRQTTGMVDFHIDMAGDNPFDFLAEVVRNLIAYLIHMFFPIHISRLVEASHPMVKATYSVAPLIRILVGLSVISYSLFAFVFGNRTLRFFLAWTFISVLPYCVIQFPADWLNIRYLYQVSIGFVFIMAAGTVLSIDLLHRRRWRRFLPLLVPLVFVLLSSYITAKLDTKYEAQSQWTSNQKKKAALVEGMR